MRAGGLPGIQAVGALPVCGLLHKGGCVCTSTPSCERACPGPPVSGRTWSAREQDRRQGAQVGVTRRAGLMWAWPLWAWPLWARPREYPGRLSRSPGGFRDDLWVGLCSESQLARR